MVLGRARHRSLRKNTVCQPFWEGHGFSHAAQARKRTWAFSPEGQRTLLFG
jgi:hypothetical protein